MKNQKNQKINQKITAKGKQNNYTSCDYFVLLTISACVFVRATGTRVSKLSENCLPRSVTSPPLK